MIKLVQATSQHAHRIQPRGVFQRNPLALDHVLSGIQTSPAVAILLPTGEVLGIVGIQRFWEGVGEIWGYTSVLVDKHPIAFYKGCTALLEAMLEKNEFRRLQVTVSATYTQGVKFIEKLGFKPEAMMRRYGPEGDDHMLFGRVF